MSTKECPKLPAINEQHVNEFMCVMKWINWPIYTMDVLTGQHVESVAISIEPTLKDSFTYQS